MRYVTCRVANFQGASRNTPEAKVGGRHPWFPSLAPQTTPGCPPLWDLRCQGQPRKRGAGRGRGLNCGISSTCQGRREDPKQARVNPVFTTILKPEEEETTDAAALSSWGSASCSPPPSLCPQTRGPGATFLCSLYTCPVSSPSFLSVLPSFSPDAPLHSAS